MIQQGEEVFLNNKKITITRVDSSIIPHRYYYQEGKQFYYCHRKDLTKRMKVKDIEVVDAQEIVPYKHIQREGESCRKNNQCNYPDCEIELIADRGRD